MTTADTTQRGYNIEVDTDYDENGNESNYETSLIGFLLKE